MTMISLKIPPELLERIDAEAKEQGITRTALLLRHWQNAEIIEGAKEWVSKQPTPAPFRIPHDPTCKCWTCKPPKA